VSIFEVEGVEPVFSEEDEADARYEAPAVERRAPGSPLRGQAQTQAARPALEHRPAPRRRAGS
jgi:hypothetical protein